MPKVRWGVGRAAIDDFDRDTQFKPYTGPIPPNGVYEWNVKKLQYVAGDKEKNTQLRIGLELAPREGRKEERRYKGFWIMAFRPITEASNMFWVPFLDAIGVSSAEFLERTITDENGNIKKIGSWRNTGDEYILASLKDGQDDKGNARKEIGSFWAIEEEELDEDELDEEDEEDYEEENEPF